MGGERRKRKQVLATCWAPGTTVVSTRVWRDGSSYCDLRDPVTSALSSTTTMLQILPFDVTLLILSFAEPLDVLSARKVHAHCIRDETRS